MGGAITVSAAAGAAPSLDPKSIVAAGASASSAPEAIGQATATAGYGSATKLADGLKDKSWAQQQAYWAGATPQEQGQLRSVGYQPPPQNLHDTSPASGIFGSIFGVAKAGWKDVATAGKDVLSAAGAPLRAVQHLARTGHVISEMGDLNAGESPEHVANKAESAGLSIDPNDFSLLFSPSAWSKAWRETTNGEQTFDPAVERQLKKTSTPEQFNLAKQVASGVPQQEIVNSYHPKVRVQVRQMLQSKQVVDLANQLNNAHMSVGQSAVGERFLTKNPGLGHKISGGLDAAFDVGGTPLMKAGDVMKGAEIARWGLNAGRAAEYAAKDTSAYRQLLNQPQVQRWVNYVGDKIANDGWGPLERTQPKIFRVAQLAAADGVTDADTLHTWLEGQAGVKAILTGDAATLSHGAAIMPHLSVTGYGRMLAKGHLTDAIDWLADRPTSKLANLRLAPDDMVAGHTVSQLALDSMRALPKDLHEIAPVDDNPFQAKMGGALGHLLLKPVSGMARIYRQLTTLTADKPYLKLTDPDSAVNLKRMLSYALPATHVNRLVDAYLASDDIGQKFDIVKGATAQMLHAAGVYSAPGGAEAGDRMMQALDDSFRNETYSPLGIDQMATGRRAAVLDNQLSDTVALPDFKEVRSVARQLKFMHGLGVPMSGAVDRFMAAWKASVLLRIGFATRVSGEEALSNGLRNGFLNYIVARLTLTSVKRTAEKAAAKADADAAIEAMDPNTRRVGAAMATAAARVPKEILHQVKNTSDLASAIFGHAAWLAYKGTGEALSRAEYYEAAQSFYDHVWQGHLADTVSSLAHSGGGYDMNDELRNIGVDKTIKTLRVRGRGGFTEAAASDPLWRLKWHYALGQVGDSDLAQEVLKNIDRTKRVQANRVVKILKSPEMDEVRRASVRSFRLPDGRIVGRDATEDEALRSWANKIVAHVNALVRSGDPDEGEILHDVVSELMTNRDAPAMETLDAVPQHQLPASTFGPDLAELPSFSRIVQTGFNGLSKIIDWISRQPITLQAYAEARKELRPWVQQLAGEGAHAEDLLSDLAAERAMNTVKPYIHDPAVRSQFEVIHRTAMPFLFAQDQFVKRWIRTFTDSPDAIRKLQLANNGLKVSGMIHTDQDGNEYFYYPGSAAVTNIIADSLNKIGLPASMPIAVPFTGEVNHLIPGASDPLAPSVGPFVAIPVKALADHFPELQPTQQALLQTGSSESWWEQIMPTTVSRLIQAATGDASSTGEFGSAMMKAIQVTTETGHGLPPDATVAQKQAYIDRVTNWTRILFFTKAAIGFGAPASPSEQFDPKNLSGDLTQLLNELPYDKAITQFLKEHPTASAYTVFMSQTSGDVPDLASTKAAGKFMDENRGFMSAHPQAAGWFIPRTTGNGPYTPAVYREQIQYGMRQSKLPAAFLNDVVMAPAADTYYKSVDAEQAALKAAGNNENAKSAIYQQFDQWKAKFTAQNPTYASYLAGGGKAQERAETIRDIQDALDSTEVPKGPQTDHVRMLMQSWENYETAYLTTDGNYSSAALTYQKQLKTAFTTWATQYTKENPDVADLWNILLQPEMGTAAIEGGVAR